MSAALVSSWSLLFRGSLAAFRLTSHLSPCPVFQDHLFVPPVCALIVTYWSWRQIFFIFAIPGLILDGLWLLFVHDRPSQSRFCSPAERNLIAEKSTGAATVHGAHHAPSFHWLDMLIRARKVETITTTGEVFRSWDVLGCAIGYAFQIGISNYLLAWIPTYLITVRKFSVMGTGMVAAAPWIGAVAGNVLGGWISDRWLDQRRKPGMMFSSIATAVMLYVLVRAPNDPVVFSLLLFTTGVVFAIGFSAYMAYPMAFVSKEKYPIAGSIVNMGGQIGGAARR